MPTLCYTIILIFMKHVVAEYAVESATKDGNVQEIAIEATYYENKNTKTDVEFPEGLYKIISKSKPIPSPNTALIIPKVEDPKGDIQIDIHKYRERIFYNATVTSIDSEIKPRSSKEVNTKPAYSELNTNVDKSENVDIKSEKSKQKTSKLKRNYYKKWYARQRNKKFSRRTPIGQKRFRKTTYNDKFPVFRRVGEDKIKTDSNKTLDLKISPEPEPILVEKNTPEYDLEALTTTKAPTKPNNFLKRLVHTLPELKGLDSDSKKLFIPKFLKVQSNNDDDLTFSVLNGQQKLEFEPKNVIFADAIEMDNLNIPNLRINQARFRRNVDEPSPNTDDSQKNEEKTADDTKNSTIKESRNTSIELTEPSANKDNIQPNDTVTSKVSSSDLDKKFSSNDSHACTSDCNSSTVFRASKNNPEDVLRPEKVLSGIESSVDVVNKVISKSWNEAKEITDGTVDAATKFFSLMSDRAKNIASSIFG